MGFALKLLHSSSHIVCCTFAQAATVWFSEVVHHSPDVVTRRLSRTTTWSRFPIHHNLL
jgi:hypothetical protein